MYSVSTVDWISCTYTMDVLKRTGGYVVGRVIHPERITADKSIWVTAKPLYGYTGASKSQNGTLFLYGGSEAMGVHIIQPGSALAKLGNSVEMVRRYEGTGARFTRVDIAIDVYESDITPSGLYRLIERGQAETMARKHSLIKSDTGETLYVGSRTSEQFMRVYEKGKLEGNGQNWIRIELELKGARAQAVAESMAHNGHAAIADVISAFCTFNTLSWKQAVRPSGVALSDVRRKLSDTRRWLLESVAPALAREIAFDAQFDLDWHNKVNEEVSKLT